MLALRPATIVARRGGPGFPHQDDGGGVEERGREERDGKEMTQTEIKVWRSRLVRKKAYVKKFLSPGLKLKRFGVNER